LKLKPSGLPGGFLNIDIRAFDRYTVTMNDDTRWKQRFQNYNKALAALKNAVLLSEKRELTELEKQGMIQGFEFTFELAWNMLKDYLTDQGIIGITGSKDTVRSAFKYGLIQDGQIWMDMIKDRNLASHVYDEETAKGLAVAIISTYYPLFDVLAEKMKGME